MGEPPDRKIENLRRRVVEEFGTDAAQRAYREFAKHGLWTREEELVEKHFDPGSSILDLGCGTGRTTLPLAEMGYRVAGIDVSERMIASARRIAAERGLEIDYEVGDATELRFAEASWDHALFSNQGWTQIPGKANRDRALAEVFRVLRPGGCYIFTAHPRRWWSRWLPFWIGQWIRFRVLRPLSVPIAEAEFGDRLFEREASGLEHERRQYIHIPRVEHVEEAIARAGFDLVERTTGRSETGGGTPVFFVCRKPPG